MPAAVAALPLPVTSATPPSGLADGAAPSIVGGDFASLLLGQLAVDAGTGELAANTELSLPLSADTLAASPAVTPDPASLLASIGITAIPLPPARPDPTGKPVTDVVPSDPTDPTTLTVALPQIPGVAQLPAPVVEKAPAERSLGIGSPPDLPPQATTVVSSLNEAPAKLAGFAQKLAEAVPPPTIETTAPPPQLANAAHLGGNVLAARQTGETGRIDAPLRDQAWPAELGQKVVWMATQDKQSAQITLNPPQLGPIEISLNVKSDQATAVFASANADVREAIESALPRLREMLAGVGVELGQTNVSAESFRQQTESDTRSRDNGGGRNEDNGSVAAGRGDAARVATVAARRGSGLVDLFA